MSAGNVKAKYLLGDLLVQRGLITEKEKEDALVVQRESGRRLGEILVEKTTITEKDIGLVLAERAGFPFYQLTKGMVDPAIVAILPRAKAELYEVLPLFRINNKLTLAICDPNKIFVLDSVHKITGCEIQPVICPKDDIIRMIGEAYEQGDVPIEDLVADFEEQDLELVSYETDTQIEDIAQIAGESPIINLVNQIILKALNEKASDIHIEPEVGFFRVRFRIDGILYEVMRQRMDLHAPVISRMKLMANLDIAERRMPQDGRMQVQAQGRTIDLRLSSLPGVLGEKIVLRVLDREKGIISLEQLGFKPKELSIFRALMSRPNGLVLVTGPTGSGKTTTLYGGLDELNSLEKNIVTIEDPVEYQFDIINQNQVKEEIGLTFALILKHTLRQDPDVLMVGEIREAETAQIAVQAALTGHLVLSMMHTNDAASSITRLLEVGVEPYLLAPSLVGVIGQRLVRVNCDECSTEYYPSKTELRALGVAEDSDIRLKRGRGCEHCFDSGYRGRVGIYEMLVSDRQFQELLFHKPSIEEIRRYQDEKDAATLRSEGIQLVLEGKTTLEEVGRSVLVE